MFTVDSDEIRIIRDGIGEIGMMTKADAILTGGWDCSQVYLMERWISPFPVKRFSSRSMGRYTGL